MFLFFIITQEILRSRRVVPISYDQVVPEVIRLFLYGALPRSEQGESA